MKEISLFMLRKSHAASLAVWLMSLTYYHDIELLLMHDVPARRKAREMKREAERLEREAEILKQIDKMEPAVNLRLQTAAMYRMKAEDLEFEARLEDLHLWKMVKRRGRKKHTNWMATWREDGKVRNVYLGSTRKITRDQALEKARRLKAKVIERLRAERAAELRSDEIKSIWDLWR